MQQNDNSNAGLEELAENIAQGREPNNPGPQVYVLYW